MVAQNDGCWSTRTGHPLATVLYLLLRTFIGLSPVVDLLDCYLHTCSETRLGTVIIYYQNGFVV